jgi:hypothetical protein
MTPAELVCAQVVAAGCETVFLGGAAWVWRALMRLNVNGPCQLGIGLLVVLRLSVAASVFSGMDATPLDYAWLTETLFSFVFLYTLYHMGILIAMCRR